MIAAIYARVSTEEQAQNFSIENQLDSLRKYCEHHEYSILKEYIDPGWSGTILDRPDLTKLLNDSRNKLFDIVVVFRLDRLFRSNRHMYNTLAEWEELGISLASVTEPFDTTTTMGKAYLGMASTFAEWERNTFLERSREGTRKAVEKGLYSGGIIAYGYQLNQNTKRLEIEENEASIVRDIFRWLIEGGKSCYSIASHLNALGVPTRYSKDGRGIRGKNTAGIWRAGRIYNMLINSAYQGEWQYGKRSKKRHLIQCKCPAIVEKDIFNKAQIRLRENNLWSDRHSRRNYLLRGLIQCEACGRNYVGFYSKPGKVEKRYYKCNTRANRRNLIATPCNSPTINADYLENLIWQQICEFIQDEHVVREALKDKYDVCKQAEFIAELATVKKRLAELDIAEQNLLVKFADPSKHFSETALEGAVKHIRNNATLLRNRITELESSIGTEEAQSQKLNEVQTILNTLKTTVSCASPDIKRKIFEQLVNNIKIDRDGNGTVVINITYYFNKSLLKPDTEVRLQSAGMPMRLLGRSCKNVYLLGRLDLPVPAEAERALYRQDRYFCKCAPGQF